MTNPIRLIVVDDHELVRAGLRGVLDSDPSLQVVAEASDGNQALAAVEIHHPDVVVMDLQMPGMGGIEATRRILYARPATAVLVLTMFDDDESVFAAVQAGAKGYLLKGARRDELRAAVNGVAVGQAVFGPGVASRILARMTGTADTTGALPELTRRERQVLELLVDGRQPPSIASRMGVAEKTVRNNISSVLTKLHVTDRAAAIALARQAGVGRALDSTSRVFVFTEIADSTGFARRLGEAYGTVIAEHNLVVDAVLTRRGGTCFGAAGDARRAWFHDDGAALVAATEVHDELTRHRFPTGTTVQVRVGVTAAPSPSTPTN